MRRVLTLYILDVAGHSPVTFHVFVAGCSTGICCSCQCIHLFIFHRFKSSLVCRPSYTRSHRGAIGHAAKMHKHRDAKTQTLQVKKVARRSALRATAQTWGLPRPAWLSTAHSNTRWLCTSLNCMTGIELQQPVNSISHRDHQQPHTSWSTLQRLWSCIDEPLTFLHMWWCFSQMKRNTYSFIKLIINQIRS